MRLLWLVGLMAILGLTEVAAMASNKTFVLVDQGVSKVTIVADEGLRPAADQFAGCLKAMSGADVPVVDSGEQAKMGKVIKLRLSELNQLPVDGYRIIFPPDEMVISGPTAEGVENGVWGLLQDSLGVRWYLPDELFKIVPQRKTVEVPAETVTGKPDFGFRIYSGVTGPNAKDWQAAMRLTRNRSGIPYFGFGHNLKHIFPVSVYGKDHPEYYALINGKRFVPKNDREERSQPCFTNPDVVEIAAKAAHEFFEKDPKATTFSLCINDNADFCTCENCRKLDEPKRVSNGTPQHSESYFQFVKQVAERVLKTDPGKYLGVYAYWGVELTPRNIDKLPENVVVALTQDTSQHIDPNYKKRDREAWLAWSRVASHLAKYDYYGLGWYTPRTFRNIAARDLAFIHDNNAIGLYCEVYPMWAVTAPQLYIAARKIWDVNVDENKLMDDYCRDLFGAASKDVRAFYDTCDRYWAEPRQGKWFQGLDHLEPEVRMLRPDLIDEAWNHLRTANAKASGIEQERVQWLIDRFRFTHSLADGFRLADLLKKASKGEKAGDVPALAKRLKANLAETESAADFLQNDPLHRHAYYAPGDRFDNKFKYYRETVKAALAEAGSG